MGFGGEMLELGVGRNQAEIGKEEGVMGCISQVIQLI